MATDWSFCLQSRQGRKIVKLLPSSTTKDLNDLVIVEFGAPVVSLKYGFPPKTLMIGEDAIISSVLKNQERIQVELGQTEASSNPIPAKKGIKQNPEAEKVVSPSTSTSTRSKSKRAAAKRATESMPEIIKRQEALMKQQPPTKKRPRAPSVSNTNARKTVKPPSRFTASAGVGRRLADGAAVTNPTTKNSRTSATRKNPTSSTDVSETLMSALNDKGKAGQILRKGMKNAVQGSYETTRAFSRLAAIQAQKYQINLDKNTIMVKYQGTVDKSHVEEKVDCIPRDVLEAVIRGIHASNQEALRPENLSLLSPRVLWSCVYCYPDITDVSEMYQKLLPDLDWTFLRRRAPQLSEKALENLRQEQEVNGEAINVQLASEAIAAVETAMENLHDCDSSQRKAKLAHAAIARLRKDNQKSEPWQLITPTETDQDELKQCIQSIEGMNDLSTVIAKLIKDARIHNWRELANVADVKMLANILDLGVNHEQVQQWVDRAQDESVGEIMVEICDNNVLAVELLTERARTGTPKDLAAWRCLPEMLHDQMGSPEMPTVTQLSSWCQRANMILKEFEWLHWYATPVA